MRTDLEKCDPKKLLQVTDKEIAAAENLAELYSSVCDAVVGIGGYVMAWIGLAEHDEEKTVLPVAHAGYNSDYIKNVDLSWCEDKESGRGPCAMAIREGRVQVVNSTRTQMQGVDRRARMLLRGYASGVALLLHDDSGTFGLMCIFAPEEGWFDAAEVETLTTLATKLTAAVKQQRLFVVRQLVEHT